MKKNFTNTDLLEPDIMIRLYSQGAFPMADEEGVISWYQPEIRTVIKLDEFNYPRSLKKFMKECDFEYRFDKDIIKIIEHCADRDETWITDELIDAYAGLEQIGHLHSVGVYQKGKLVGGLYGVTYKGAFFGESMFSKVSQASKSALVKLVERLRVKGFTILDVQFQTDHLKMFGTIEIPFLEYSDLLVEAYKNSSIVF